VQIDRPALHRLRERLKELERSQGWVAKKLDVHPVTVWRWCNGKVAVPARRQRELSLLLGIPVSDLAPTEAPTSAAAKAA
jgi:hypothetical protein